MHCVDLLKPSTGSMSLYICLVQQHWTLICISVLLYTATLIQYLQFRTNCKFDAILSKYHADTRREVVWFFHHRAGAPLMLWEGLQGLSDASSSQICCLHQSCVSRISLDARCGIGPMLVDEGILYCTLEFVQWSLQWSPHPMNSRTNWVVAVAHLKQDMGNCDLLTGSSIFPFFTGFYLKDTIIRYISS